MSYLLSKSNINIKSANCLKEEKNYYSSSVHCSYYACVQTAKHILLFDLSYSLSAIFEGMKNKKGFHNYYIKEIFNNLKTTSLSDARNFNSKIRDLRNIRNESDYEDIEILQIKSDNAYLKAKEILSILKRNYAV
jgi:hypothetical protein